MSLINYEILQNLATLSESPHMGFTVILLSSFMRFINFPIFVSTNKATSLSLISVPNNMVTLMKSWTYLNFLCFNSWINGILSFLNLYSIVLLPSQLWNETFNLN